MVGIPTIPFIIPKITADESFLAFRAAADSTGLTTSRGSRAAGIWLPLGPCASGLALPPSKSTVSKPAAGTCRRGRLLSDPGDCV